MVGRTAGRAERKQDGESDPECAIPVLWVGSESTWTAEDAFCGRAIDRFINEALS